MFKVLTKVICPKELLRLVALAELVIILEVVYPCLPVCRVRELVAAVATDVCVTPGS